MTRTRLLCGFIVLAVAAASYYLVRTRASSPPAPSAPLADLETARRHLKAGRVQQALDAARPIAEADRHNVEAQFLVAECLTRQKQTDEALGIYEQVLQVPKLQSDQRKVALQCAGEIHLQDGRVQAAEEHFRKVLQLDPHYTLAHNRLAFLLGLEGRRWESIPHLIALLKQDDFGVFQLLLLANPEKNLVVDEFLQRVKQNSPGYLIPLIPEAKEALIRGEYHRAAGLIERLIASDPEQIEVKMLEGALAFYQSDRTAFVKWSQSLSLYHESHPEAWLLRGRWARAEGDLSGATRCFAEAFYRDPNSLEACSALTQLLRPQQEKQELIDYFQQRTRRLEDLQEKSHILHGHQQNVRLMEHAFSLCDFLERYWEAWGWCRAALAVDPSLEWARQGKEEIEPHLVYDLPQTLIFENVNEWEYSRYELPAWQNRSSTTDRPLETAAAAGGAFRALAADVGLDFQYEDAHDHSRDDPANGRKIYSTTGGGIGVIDFDLDLFPDVYLSQGAPQGVGSTDPEMTDRLFRNLGGERFEDVTRGARIVELSFSQGVCAADVDSDGFADLYIANLGANRLFLNNGDGTFTDAGSPGERRAEVWTTSVAIADLNGDGHPDLYDVNYVVEEGWERLCENNGGYLRTCNPRMFSGERDRLLLSNGDGTFTSVPDAFGEDADQAMGLGILIADYFQDGHLQIFVANDTVANNFYRLEHSPALRLVDNAIIQGLAFDVRGRAQACMGVAFGDFDGNHTFDLMVTNFYGDYNTLYLQHHQSFHDLTHSSNLAALSYSLLGFGTQALDAELDGDLDLFVANGHIDDFLFQQIPYRMVPQFIVNDGRGRFSAVPPAEAGEYFARELLGRAAARLDWNRDGREDLVVSHLDSPTILLSNELQPQGRSLRLSLVGTKGTRMPVGTIVELIDGEDIRIAQVTAGSGYFVSNESLLVLPVVTDGPVAVRVRWPDQTRSKFEDLEPGRHYCCVEGSQRMYLLP